MAHGYAKVANKPMATLMHGTVGIQHAAMAVYNAWCDRVPMLIFGGNHMDSTERRPGVEYKHAAQDPMLIIRDFTKWDDQPTSLQAMCGIHRPRLQGRDHTAVWPGCHLARWAPSGDVHRRECAHPEDVADPAAAGR